MRNEKKRRKLRKGRKRAKKKVSKSRITKIGAGV